MYNRRPISPCDEIRLVDAFDVDVQPGAVGQLLTRGPYTIRGYYDALPHNALAFTADGFYRTGDLARLHSDGCLEVVGRDKDQINRGGEKVSPEEVEEAILATGLVTDVVVISRADHYLGEKVVGVIIPNKTTVVATLKRELRGVIAAYKIPDEFIEVEHFPVTGVGKLSRKELRQQLQIIPFLEKVRQ